MRNTSKPSFLWELMTSAHQAIVVGPMESSGELRLATQGSALSSRRQLERPLVRSDPITYEKAAKTRPLYAHFLPEADSLAERFQQLLLANKNPTVPPPPLTPINCPVTEAGSSGIGFGRLSGTRRGAIGQSEHNSGDPTRTGNVAHLSRLRQRRPYRDVS